MEYELEEGDIITFYPLGPRGSKMWNEKTKIVMTAPGIFEIQDRRFEGTNSGTIFVKPNSIFFRIEDSMIFAHFDNPFDKIGAVGKIEVRGDLPLHFDKYGILAKLADEYGIPKNEFLQTALSMLLSAKLSGDKDDT